MNTDAIGGFLPSSYNPLSNKQTNKLLSSNVLKDVKNNKTQDELGNTSTNQEIKNTIHDIESLNKDKGLFQDAKIQITIINQSINNALSNMDISLKEALTNVNETLTKSVNKTYDEKVIFNENIFINSIDKETLNMQLQEPDMQNLNDLYQLHNQTQNILKDINKVESKVNAKIDKAASSIDYTQTKEKKEFDETRIKDFKYDTQLYENMVNSTAVENKLLWLLG